MIVPMSRVLIVGPKIISAEVIRLLHKMGRLHITPVKPEGSVGRVELTPAESKLKLVLEKLQLELDGLLTVLGYRGKPAKAAVPEDWEKLLADLVVQRAEINQLVKQKMDLSDELALIENYRAAFEALSPLMSKLESSRRIKAFGFLAKASESAALDALHRELRKLTEGRIEFYSQQLDEKKIAALVAFHISDADKVKGFFAKAGVNELKLPTAVASLNMAEAVSQLKEKSRQLPEMISRIANQLAGLAEREAPAFEAYRMMVRDELSRLKAREELPEGRFTFYLQGYLPADDLPRLIKLLHDKFGNQVSVQELEIGRHDAGKTPVILKNNPLVKPFELLLLLFSPPQYGSIDPTLFIAIFFPLYFGFIIGDIGFGLVLAGAGLFLLLKFKRHELLRSVGTIVMLCSVWTVLFGVLFGELFGDFGEHLHLVRPMSESFNRMSKESLFTVLGLALGFGVLQIFTGYVIGIINGVRHNDRHHILEPIAFMVGLVGLALAIVGVMKILPLAGLIAGGTMVVISMGMLGSLVGLAGPIELFGAVGNILSYARLFAIGLSAVYLAFAANLISRLVIANGGIWIAVGILTGLVVNALFFVVGLISPIAQPGRLQVVEFFTKFKYFDNPGKPYKPFKTIGGD